MDHRDIITMILAERLEMGVLLATAERLDIDGDEAQHLAEWLVGELDQASIGLELLGYPDELGPATTTR